MDVHNPELLKSPTLRSPVPVPASEFVAQLERFDLEALRETIAKAVQMKQEAAARLSRLEAQVEERSTRVRLLEADKADLQLQLDLLRDELAGLHGTSDSLHVMGWVGKTE